MQNQFSEPGKLAVIPEDIRLKSPTIKEIMEIIGGKLICGEELIANQADHFIMGAMQVPNFLTHIKENVLIVTPGDRADIIMTALQANISANYPKVSGIVLTGGFEPEEPVLKLIEGLQTVVPIIAVESPSFKTATHIGAIQSRISPDNSKKIERAIDTFKKFVNIQALDGSLVTFRPEGMTPYMFQYQLVK